MRRALAFHLFDARRWHALGWNRLEHKDLAGAASCFATAVELDRDLAAGWYNLGWTLAELGRLPLAVGALRRALSLAPGHADARTCLVRLLMRDGRETEAFQVWWEGQKRRP